MVEQIQTLLGITVPQQFEPLLVLVAGWFLVLLVSFFAEFLKNLILRW